VVIQVSDAVAMPTTLSTEMMMSQVPVDDGEMRELDFLPHDHAVSMQVSRILHIAL